MCQDGARMSFTYQPFFSNKYRERQKVKKEPTMYFKSPSPDGCSARFSAKLARIAT
jgi:hypothetical protein